jgi:5'(3')-deoxyribonucleotidase
MAEHYDLYAVTATQNTAMIPDKAQWLAKYFPHIPEKNYIFCFAKHLIGTDILIDDGAHNAKGFKGKFLLFDQPWNRDCRLTRVKGWQGVKAELEYHNWL